MRCAITILTALTCITVGIFSAFENYPSFTNEVLATANDQLVIVQWPLLFKNIGSLQPYVATAESCIVLTLLLCLYLVSIRAARSRINLSNELARELDEQFNIQHELFRLRQQNEQVWSDHDRALRDKHAADLTRANGIIDAVEKERDATVAEMEQLKKDVTRLQEENETLHEPKLMLFRTQHAENKAEEFHQQAQDAQAAFTAVQEAKHSALQSELVARKELETEKAAANLFRQEREHLVKKSEEQAKKIETLEAGKAELLQKNAELRESLARVQPFATKKSLDSRGLSRETPINIVEQYVETAIEFAKLRGKTEATPGLNVIEDLRKQLQCKDVELAKFQTENSHLKTDNARLTRDAENVSSSIEDVIAGIEKIGNQRLPSNIERPSLKDLLDALNSRGDAIADKLQKVAVEVSTIQANQQELDAKRDIISAIDNLEEQITSRVQGVEKQFAGMRKRLRRNGRAHRGMRGRPHARGNKDTGAEVSLQQTGPIAFPKRETPPRTRDENPVL